MNRLAEKIAKVLGSAWVIGAFGLWTIVHAFIAHSYVATISDLAIEIGLMILRAEDVQSARTEEISRKDLRATRRIEKKL